MVLILLFMAGFALAYVNGANDVSKGIATLVGSGVTNYWRAIMWGTLWTGIGGIAGAFLARAMIATFGSGLLASGVHATESAALATVVGAALWIALATVKGWPVSTTHAIVGSVAGTATLAYGFGGVNWSSLGGKIALPLLLSPVVALLTTSVLLRVWKALAPDLVNDCLCAQLTQPMEIMAGGATTMYASSVVPQLQVTECKSSEGAFPKITLSHLHWLTSGATSFARGLNDVPKMVAILLSAAVLTGNSFDLPFAYFVAVSLGVVAGSWIAGRRITEVLACDVTRMNHPEGFVANLVTATLVGFGATLGWPMSTTQVASGAIIGIASTGKEQVNGKTVWAMVVAWVVTLPAAALLGAVALLLLRVVGMR